MDYLVRLVQLVLEVRKVKEDHLEIREQQVHGDIQDLKADVVNQGKEGNQVSLDLQMVPLEPQVLKAPQVELVLLDNKVTRET